MTFKEELNGTFEDMRYRDIGFSDGFNTILAKYRHRLLEEFLEDDSSKRVLEIGGAEGLCTQFLANRFDNLTVLEPIVQLASSLSVRFPSTTIHWKTLEKFDSKDKFDYIIAFNVLEHVEDDIEFLECARELMHNKSKFILTVPNALSIHRQLGRELGKIDDIFALTETDKLVGHKRYYHEELLEAKLKEQEFTIEELTSVFYKPFPNHVMSQLTEEYYDALHALGHTHARYGAELFAVVRRDERNNTRDHR